MIIEFNGWRVRVLAGTVRTAIDRALIARAVQERRKSHAQHVKGWKTRRHNEAERIIGGGVDNKQKGGAK
jgi:hypothetical protein